MELVNEIVNNPFALYIPVALVLVAAILLFAFGFKSAEQPQFDKLSSISNEDRKTTGKKRKLKEKKAAVNGNAINISDSTVDKSPSKEIKRKEHVVNSKKSENIVKPADRKKGEPVKNKIIEDKNKRNLKAKVNEKPLDFDEGDWETVPAKGEKKKKQESPVKKEKKNKKTDKAIEIDKLVKDVVNKELQEKEKIKELTPIIKEVEQKEEIAEVKIEPVEIKKEKKAEKKSRKPDVEKIENLENEKTIVAVASSSPKPEEIVAKVPSGNVAFDELGDLWTDAKQAKKSKKKSRRDN